MEVKDNLARIDMAALLVAEARKRICEENIPRLKRCLQRLSEEQIWNRPDPALVSVGNLVLHLNGNARQWILHTLCGLNYERDRDGEFQEHGPLPSDTLIALLDSLDADLGEHLDAITADTLLREHEVQVFRESGVGVLVHAIEHFSYHTGQIARETKRFTGQDLAFYGGLPL